jgi:acetyl-CoA carboxylase carboxyl transferase subunit beta
VHRTTEKAADMAESQGVRSADLLSAGIVDRIVPETPDAADEPEEFCRRVGEVLRQELSVLLGMPPEQRRELRHLRYRSLGLPRPT